MDIRTKFTLNIPEALIKAFGITEDTLFIVKYESGELTLEPINNYKTESNLHVKHDVFEWIKEIDKDCKKHGRDVYETHKRNNNNENMLTDCGIDCDYVCGKCQFRNMHEKACNEDKE